MQALCQYFMDLEYSTRWRVKQADGGEEKEHTKLNRTQNINDSFLRYYSQHYGGNFACSGLIGGKYGHFIMELITMFICNI